MSERHNITTRNRAQRGASMPLALLLFLICAMTASIVLAASSAAVGRAASLADTDQAYYSTTSAVNLFRDQLAGPDGQGHEVTVAVMKDASDTAAPYKVLVSTDNTTATNNYSVLERAAMRLFFGRDANSSVNAQDMIAGYFTSSTAWEHWSESLSAGKVASYDLKHAPGSLSSAQLSALQLEVDASIDDEGDLVFTFLKKDESTGEYLAIFNLTCDADIETGILESSEAGNGAEIKYATVTWLPAEVEKG